MNQKNSFLIVWIGQLISLLGSSLTGFALSIWIFQLTGSTKSLAIMVFCRFLPLVYMSMVAGPFVDKFDRKTLLLIADCSVAATSVGVLYVVTSSYPNLHLLYAILISAGIFESFQSLAVRTTVTIFIRKEFYTRYNGIVTIIESIPLLIAPLVAALLLSVTSISGIIVIDLISFGVSTATLLSARFPALPKVGIKNIFTRETLTEGASFICSHPSLFKLQTLFTTLNFLNGVTAGLLVAYLLIKTNNSAESVAIATSMGATGAIIGGLLASVIKINRPRILFMLICLCVSGITGRALLPYIDGAILIGFMLMLRNALVSLVNANNDTIWQAKVAAHIQGRVFGARRVLGQGMYPPALLLGGYLSEHIFSNENLSRFEFLQYLQLPEESLGLSFLFLLTGLLECAVAIASGMSADLLEVESCVPDQDYIPSEA